MNLTKKITAVFLALAMLFIFASCGEESEEVLDIGTVNIGIIVDGDTAEEGSYANVQYNNFKAAYSAAGAGDSQVTEQTNIKPGDSAAMEKAMADLVARGCRLIVGTDEGYYNDFTKYAKDNPSAYFITMADYKNIEPELSNVAVFTIRNYETEYLEGLIAASYSSTGKIGYVVDSSFMTADTTDINAFLLGAQSVNPQASVSLVIASDVKAGCEKVLADGCDILYTRNYKTDEEGNTYFEVPASVKDNMCLVSLKDGKPTFISAACQNLNVLYTKIITATVNEKFSDLEGYTCGVKEGIVDVRPVSDEAVQAKVDALKDKLNNGENILGVQNISDLGNSYLDAVTELK